MTAIAEDQSTDEVIADIEQKVAERKEALETVENDLLIRDRFDLSEEDEEILDVIDRSQHGDVGEDDIEILVREFFDEFGGDIRGIRPGPARSEGDIFQLEVPNILSGGQISNQYKRATFTRKIAREQDDVDFIALDHPLVQSIIDFCLESDRIEGDIAVKVRADEDRSPGICFTYRLGYVSGTGDAVTEKLARLYVTTDREVVNEPPEYIDTLAPSEVGQSKELDELATIAEELHDAAEMRAWDEVESFAGEAREEREREVKIKRDHAERHFEEQIEKWEERLEQYRAQDGPNKDMSAPIGNAKQKLDELRRKRETELSRLEEERHVTPEEPELVTATYVITEN